MRRPRRHLPGGKPERPHKINGAIRNRTLRVIGMDGSNLGVMDRRAALTAADAEGLDLVLTSPQADPPVAKIMDYGKHLYERSKKERERKAKQGGGGHLKEVRFKINIDEGDFEVRLKRIMRFLSQGHRVKVTVQFRRWRERIHKGRALVLLDKIKEEAEGIGQVLSDVRTEVTQSTLILAPAKG